MVLTLSPGTYSPGRYGVRVARVDAITANGCATLIVDTSVDDADEESEHGD